MKGTKGIVIVAFFVWATALVGAKQPPGDNPPGSQGGDTRFDQSAVERGQKMFVAQCGFCHGSKATGGQTGPDLIRSVLVMGDEDGKQLGEFLKAGRPDKGMPKFDLSQEQARDIAAFLHQRIAAVIDRGAYKILNILVGDAKAGEAYFSGAGKCNTCHSVTGDLAGIGAKMDPKAIQNALVSGRAGRGGAAAPVTTVQVTLAGGKMVEGKLDHLDDFVV